MKQYLLFCLPIFLIAVSPLVAKGLDFNGDGISDLINVQEGAGGNMDANVLISNGSSFSQQSWASGQGSFWETQRWFYGDFNGDGMTDIAKLWKASTAMSCDVHLSDGSKFSIGNGISDTGTFAYTDKWFSGDFNGDGMTDLLRGYDNGGRSFDVVLSNGNGFDASATWASGQGGFNAQQYWLTGDYNGDGMTDVMIIFGATQMTAEVHLSTGTGFTRQTWATDQGGKTTKMKWLSDDFDGDGMTDIAKLWWTDNNVSIDVHRSTGSAFVIQSWLNNQNIGFDRADLWVKGDFNGDSNVDIARIKKDNGMLSVDLLQSDGSSFSNSTVINRAITFRDQTRYLVGDYNGDGSDDIVACHADDSVVTYNILNLANGTVDAFGTNSNDGYFQSRMVQETVFGDTFINYGQIEGPVPANANLQAIMNAGNDLYLEKRATYEIPYTLTYKRDYQRMETYNALFLDDFAKCLHTMNGNNEVDSTISGRSNTDYITLRNVCVDGNRYGGFPIKIRPPGAAEGAMVAFGIGDGHVVKRVVLMSTRTWSSCQIHEAQGSKDSIVVNNFVFGAGNGVRGCGRQLNEDPAVMGKVGWGDGFSIAGINTTVKQNFIMDCTDVGIVLFCAPASQCTENYIVNVSRASLGAINMVDGITAHEIGNMKYDYRNTTVKDNIINAYGGRIMMGIPHSSQAWNNRDPKLFVGAKILDNHVTGNAFGYGFVLASLQNITFTGNTSDANHTGKAYSTNTWNPPAAVPFLRENGTVTGTYQNGMTTHGSMNRLLYNPGRTTGPFNADGYHHWNYTQAVANSIVRSSYLEMLGRAPTNAEFTAGGNYFMNDSKKYGDQFKRQLMGLQEFKDKFGNINPNSNQLHPFRIKRWLDVITRLDSESLKTSGNFSNALEIFDPALQGLEYSRAADYVSVDVPDSVAPGATFEASVTFKNTSSFEWTRAGGFKLGSQNPQDNGTWGTDRIQIEEAVTVQPGQNYSFSRTFTAPASEGVYNFQWRPVEEGVAWFGQTSANVTIEVSQLQPDSSEFVSQVVPSTVEPGEAFVAEVTFKNIGTNSWTAAGGYRLVSQNPLDNTVWSVNSRTDVIGSVAPDGSQTFSIPCVAPAAEGSYDFQWQMIQEGGVGVFGQTSTNTVIDVMPIKPPGLIERTDDPAAIVSAEFAMTDAAYAVENIFDNDVSSKYQTANSSAWIQHQFGGGSQHKLKWYTVTSAMEGPLEPGSANMINNASFENALNATNNWKPSSSNKASLSTNQAQAGNQSLRLSTGTAESIAPTEQTISLAANTDYELRAWVYNPGQTAGRVILDTNDVFDSSTGPNGPGGSAQFVIDAGDAASWTEYIGTFNSGSEASVKLRIFTNADFNGTTFIDNVTLRVAPVPGDAAPHDPASWSLSGSNDGSTWDVLDSRSGISFSGRGETKEFSAINNNASYEYYRLTVSNNGGSMLQISEMELWCEDTVVPLTPYEQCLVDLFGGPIETINVDLLLDNDRDGDGIPDVTECMLGSDPYTPDSETAKPQVARAQSGIGLSFKRASRDVNYVVQKSSDLVTWEDHKVVSDSDGLEGSDINVVVSDSEMLNGKLFLRLKMEN